MASKRPAPEEASSPSKRRFQFWPTTRLFGIPFLWSPARSSSPSEKPDLASQSGTEAPEVPTSDTLDSSLTSKDEIVMSSDITSTSTPTTASCQMPTKDIQSSSVSGDEVTKSADTTSTFSPAMAPCLAPETDIESLSVSTTSVDMLSVEAPGGVALPATQPSVDSDTSPTLSPVLSIDGVSSTEASSPTRIEIYDHSLTPDSLPEIPAAISAHSETYQPERFAPTTPSAKQVPTVPTGILDSSKTSDSGRADDFSLVDKNLMEDNQEYHGCDTPKEKHVTSVETYVKFVEYYGIKLPYEQFIGLCLYLYAISCMGYRISSLDIDDFVRRHADYVTLLPELEASQVAASTPCLKSYHAWFMDYHAGQVTSSKSIISHLTLETIRTEHPYSFLKMKLSLDLIAGEVKRQKADDGERILEG